MTRKSSRPRRESPAKPAERASDGAEPSRRGRRVGLIRRKNRERILAAAEIVFAERGYQGTTTALIAKKAALPKANLHYYFPTKLHVYKALISSILELWLSAFGSMNPDDDPAEALTKYIRTKIDYSRTRPLASRVFANEIISGAPVMRDFLSNELRDWVREKCLILRRWARAGKMAPLARPEHLFFVIWAATQTYADFSAQICYVLGKKALSNDDYEAGAKLVARLVLTGCAIAPSRTTGERRNPPAARTNPTRRDNARPRARSLQAWS